MTPEIAYLSHDNSIDLILKADGVGVDLSTMTSMTLTFGTKKITSGNLAADPIRWNQAGYAIGEIRIFLEDQVITPAQYHAPLVVYDPTNADGIVWGEILIEVKAEVEGTT